MLKKIWDKVVKIMNGTDTQMANAGSQVTTAASDAIGLIEQNPAMMQIREFVAAIYDIPIEDFSLELLEEKRKKDEDMLVKEANAKGRHVLTWDEIDALASKFDARLNKFKKK